MKEDYLWNKTGSDPEIKRLENVLKTFRQQDSKAPLIATQTVNFGNRAKTQRNPLRLFSFGIASFACLAVVVVGIVLFQMSGSGSAEIVKSESDAQAEKPAAETALEITARSDIRPKTNEPDVISDPVQKAGFEPGRTIRARKNVKQVSRIQNSANTLAKFNSPRRTDDQEVILTKEEKYAYDQLMLGLSITSSNLKMVKDKANGIRQREMPKKPEK